MNTVDARHLKTQCSQQGIPALHTVRFPPSRLPDDEENSHQWLNCPRCAIWSSTWNLDLPLASEGCKGRDSLNGTFETLNIRLRDHMPSHNLQTGCIRPSSFVTRAAMWGLSQPTRHMKKHRLKEYKPPGQGCPVSYRWGGSHCPSLSSRPGPCLS